MPNFARPRLLIAGGALAVAAPAAFAAGAFLASDERPSQATVLAADRSPAPITRIVHAALNGKIDTGRRPLHAPFAEVHVHTTLLVFGFPIVVHADLTYFYQVTASGQVSVDAEQKTTGDVSLGAEYREGTGWSRLPVATAVTTPGKHLVVTGSATATATIGAQLTVALYGTVGASLEWAPYLRVDVGALIPKIGWAIYAGYDLHTALSIQLQILGIPIVGYTADLPPLHGEWKLASGVFAPES